MRDFLVDVDTFFTLPRTTMRLPIKASLSKDGKLMVTAGTPEILASSVESWVDTSIGQDDLQAQIATSVRAAIAAHSIRFGVPVAHDDATLDTVVEEIVELVHL